MIVSPRQIRAARGLLGWTRTELADRAILSVTTVADIERNDVNPRASTLSAVILTLEKAGIEFLRADASGKGEGVRLTRHDI
ncbi:helix-turn-helix domain-containing protein [Nitrospirillum sp. BR 11163]|uniref:helix-turn-helix domain-containing protein n=1 Tax=Nitrospirillum sp. BR 11163 TaxID=3104323 RepID=UPI002AFDF810|nr:helix-turn-helix domain-containing protein [Nitrospirillum sp. BR 11163]MEA1675480.1 helix-turn-helix domain-containing protein [Nitrospirillum sp. BR 11163]